MKNAALAVLLLPLGPLACASPTEGSGGAAPETSEQAYADHGCLEGQKAAKQLEGLGFLRTEETTSLEIASSWHGTNSYFEVPLYRYEHADGRVQYAHCKSGRVGPRFPVKNVVLDVAGHWTAPGDPSKPAPVPGVMHLVLRDYRLSTLSRLVADVSIDTPYLHVDQRTNRHVTTTLTQQPAFFSWDVAYEQMELTMTVDDAFRGAAYRLAVVCDAKGTVTSATVSPVKGDSPWTFTAP